MTDFTSYREMNGKEVKHLASVAVSNLLKEKEDFAESLAKGLISNGLIQTEFCCDKNEDEILAAVKNELLDNLSAPKNIVGEQEEQRKYYISNEELEILKYET